MVFLFVAIQGFSQVVYFGSESYKFKSVHTSYKWSELKACSLIIVLNIDDGKVIISDGERTAFQYTYYTSDSFYDEDGDNVLQLGAIDEEGKKANIYVKLRHGKGVLFVLYNNGDAFGFNIQSLNR